MARGTNGAAMIIGSSRQNLGNLGCWGVGYFEKRSTAAEGADLEGEVHVP
jgi:hypothetical protein